MLSSGSASAPHQRHQPPRASQSRDNRISARVACLRVDFCRVTVKNGLRNGTDGPKVTGGQIGIGLKRFPAKARPDSIPPWSPVRVKKTRQNENREL